MGKWAMYRKRARVTAAPTLVPAPPAPLLVLANSLLAQTAQGANDSGGKCFLYGTLNEGLDWDLLDQQAWQPTAGWDPADYQSYADFRATEQGNGVVYLGESPPSAVVDLG